jgi:hypothetical protein
VTVTVLLTPPGGRDYQTALSYARDLGWTVAGSLADPAQATAAMTGHRATRVMTTMDVLIGIGRVGTRVLLDQIESAGGELHASVPTNTRPPASRPPSPHGPQAHNEKGSGAHGRGNR